MQNDNSVCFAAIISEIKPIEGADKIEQAVVSGWNCIVPKGVYKPGKLVIVATTDAVIPKELSDELKVTDYLRKGQRVRTVKLRGVYSECLIMDMIHANKICKEGDDLMDIMGIYKYEPPAKMVQLASGKTVKYHENPNFHIYYKFPNAKNVPDMFSEGDEVEITRKIHGTNARYGIVKKSKISLWDRIKKLFGNRWAEYEFVVGSHNVEKGSDSQGYYDTNVWYDMAEKLKIKEKLWEIAKAGFFSLDEFGSGLTIYGEIYGAGIQKNYDYGLSAQEFVGFDVMLNGKYLNTVISEYVISIRLGLKYVEVLYSGPYSKAEVDKHVYNNFVDGTKVPHEGVVVKHVSGDRHKVAKFINPEYLIFAEKHNVGDSH